MSLLFKKIKREVGFNFIHGLRGIGRSIGYKLLYRPNVELNGDTSQAPQLRGVAGEATADDILKLEGIENADRFFHTLKTSILYKSFDETDPTIVDALNRLFHFVDTQPDSWYRSVKLRSWDHDTTKNDHWEFHMVPWHRWFHYFADCYMDVRLRPYLEQTFDRLERFREEHKPWMTVFPTGSNVGGVLLGYAFHDLLGYAYRHDDKFIGRYEKYYGRFLANLKLAYDITKLERSESIPVPHIGSTVVPREALKVSVPHEGVLYGTFLLWGSVPFDFLQRKLRIPALYDEPELKYLNNYLAVAKTLDKGWHTSGDSRAYEVMPAVKERLDKLYPEPELEDGSWWFVSKRKGEILFNRKRGDSQIMLVAHANRSLPFWNTLHFGLKPGHYMVYVKESGKEGEWIVDDPGYVNYFREDYTNIDENSYNTDRKQKLFTRGRVKVKVKGWWTHVTVKTCNPKRKRVFSFNNETGEYEVF